MSMIVRPLTAADQPAWRRLWRDYLAFYETTRDEAIYATCFARLLGDDPQDYNGLLAEVDGETVGLAHYLFHRHGWSIENTCYLQDLYTVPARRGAGIGRALIEAVYDRAAAAGCASVYWLTRDDNVAARRLYDRIGDLTPFIKYQRSLT